MERISEYKIISCESESTLTKHVNAEIFDGWQPYGSIATNENLSQGGHRYKTFTQPMVKYSNSIPLDMGPN